MGIECKGKLLCINEKYKVLYKSGTLYVYTADSEKLLFSFSFFSGIYKLLSKIRLFERLLRLEARCAVAITEDVFLVSCSGKVFRVDVSNKLVITEHQYIGKMKNPLSFCMVEHDGTVDVLYGEYGWNVEKRAVGVWCRTDNMWKNVFSFQDNMIKHIHQIAYDKYRNEYLIATGDTDEESGIWRMDARFQTVEPILYGSQQFRSCAVFPTKEGFVFATDTPIANNYLYSYSYNDKKVTRISQMPGPCIYASSSREAYFFATSVEPDSNLNTLRYRITYKLGSGVMDRFTHIMRYQSGVLDEIAKFRKDIFPMWLFQFGNCQFPVVQDNTSSLYITPVAVQQYDNKTIKL